MKTYEFEGKTENQALNLALYELNVDEKDLIYKSREEKSGLLKSKKTIISCIKLIDVIDETKKIIKEILNYINVNANIEVNKSDESIKINIHSENNSILIGKKGHILEAFQTYIRQAIFNETGEFINILIDIEDYKSKQNYFLKRDVKQIAAEVLKTKVSVNLDPMNSYQRKIVHDTLAEYKELITYSKGEEPNRYIVISIKETN